MRFLMKFFIGLAPKQFVICRSILKMFFIRFQFLFLANKYLYNIEDLKKIISTKKKREMYIFGSGSSIKDLDDLYFNDAKNAISFATGRWYTHHFVPDILYLEFNSSRRKYKWLDIFAKGLNNKKEDYKNTLILVNIPLKDLEKLSNEFLIKIDPILRKKIRFITVITASECKNFFKYVLNNNTINFLIKKWSILIHCKSSISLGLTISKILGIRDVHIAGVDGYSGYFMKYNKDWGKLENQIDNTHTPLHSSADPKYGIPTIIDCFVSCEGIFNLKVSSKNSKLYEELNFSKNKFHN